MDELKHDKDFNRKINKIISNFNQEFTPEPITPIRRDIFIKHLINAYRVDRDTLESSLRYAFESILNHNAPTDRITLLTIYAEIKNFFYK